jgi:Na+/melibiose symporter-like transporter
MHVFSPSLIIVYSLMGLINAYFAKRSGRNPYLWFSMGVFFGVLSLAALFFLNFKVKKPPQKILPKPIEDSKLWYYLLNNEQLGPVSLNKISSLLQEGKITDSTYVWNETLEKWKSLKETIEYTLFLKEKST